MLHPAGMAYQLSFGVFQLAGILFFDFFGAFWRPVSIRISSLIKVSYDFI
jgi:hypothetical protein